MVCARYVRQMVHCFVAGMSHHISDLKNGDTHKGSYKIRHGTLPAALASSVRRV
jgi:hypothetical protein